MSRDETTAKRRRFEKRKVAAAPPISENIIDLTIGDDEQEDSDQLNHVNVASMEIPAHLESDDYFQILSLSRSASESDIKRAYRKLAVKWHPDKNRLNPRAEEIFKRISEAYEVLSDLEKRQHYENYDNEGGPRRTTHTTEPFRYTNDRAARNCSAQRARDIFEAFFGGEDPFEAFFGRGRRGRAGHGSTRFENDPFESMGFGAMGMGVTMPGFGRMGRMATTDQFFSDGFEGRNGANGAVFSTSTSSSSSSMFTDQNGNVIEQKTTTNTGSGGRMETVTEEYRNGKLVNRSSSATCSRLADAGRMQLDGRSSDTKRSYQRR